MKTPIKTQRPLRRSSPAVKKIGPTPEIDQPLTRQFVTVYCCCCAVGGLLVGLHEGLEIARSGFTVPGIVTVSYQDVPLMILLSILALGVLGLGIFFRSLFFGFLCILAFALVGLLLPSSLWPLLLKLGFH